VARIAGSETQPSCFCTSQRIGITADCCRPAGKLAIQRRASFIVAGAKVKLAGWLAARRRIAVAAVVVLEIDHGWRRTLKSVDLPEHDVERSPRGRSPKWRHAGQHGRSTVDLPEHNVERTEDRRDVGQHVAAVHPVHGLQVRIARGADLQRYGLLVPSLTR
jgi:hypothetical protein